MKFKRKTENNGGDEPDRGNDLADIEVPTANGYPQVRERERTRFLS